VGVTAKDDFTLEIKLEEPTSYFIHLLAHTVMLPVPRHIVEKFGKDWTQDKHIVSNGPFILEAWRHNQELIMARNPEYPGQFSGNLERIEMSIQVEDEDNSPAYLEGNSDLLILGIQQQPEKILRMRQQHADEYLTEPQISSFFLTMDVNKSPFDDWRVRRAFSLAIDQDILAGETALGLVDSATGGIVTPGMPGHSPGIGLKHNLEEAKKLMNAAGYPEGKGFPVVKGIGADYPFIAPINNYLKTNLHEALGVQLDWKDMPFQEALDQIMAGAADFWTGGWVPDYPDPHNFLAEAIWLQSSHWRNEKYLELLSRARQSIDQEERLGFYRKAEEILIAEAPTIPLVYGRIHMLRKPWVDMPRFSLASGLEMKDVSLRPH